MSSKYNAFIIALKEDISETQAAAMVAAFQCFDNVIKVEPVETNITQQLADMRVRTEIALKLWDALYGEAK